MNGSEVLKSLHRAFATIRSSNSPYCPTGVDFILTGNSATYLNLAIEITIDGKLEKLCNYQITIVRDTLMIDMVTYSNTNLDHLAANSYATRMVELAHNHVNHNNYDWKTA